MEHHRNPQLRRLVENGREALIVDPHQTPVAIAHTEAKVLPELDALDAALCQLVQPVTGFRNKVRLIHTGPVHPGNAVKPAWIGRMKLMQNLDRLRAGFHSDVHDLLDAAPVHHPQHIGRIQSIEMIVIVDHRKARQLNRVLRRHQHRLRLKLSERQPNLGFRCHHRDEFIFFCRHPLCLDAFALPESRAC